MSHLKGDEPCGRLTTRGEPCRLRRAVPGAWAAPPSEPSAPACRKHLDKSERTQFVRRERKLTRQWEERQRTLREFDPACWSWPVPERADDATGNEAWRQFVEFHADRCAVCGTDRARLVIDHDHETGRIRGLLCHECNIAEGMSVWPNSALERYQDKNPASILGYVVQYRHPMTGRPDWGRPEWSRDEQAAVWEVVRRGQREVRTE